MKQLLFACAAALCVWTADAQLKTPAPSPSHSFKQEFGLGSIEVSYSRPGVKGRKVFGDLVPFDAVWRTGANSATTISFSDEVSIGGTKIAPGKYGILTIPGKKTWVLIISKQTDVTSPADYKQDQDVVRVNLEPLRARERCETFTIEVTNIKNTSCDLEIKWDRTEVRLPITTDVDSKVMAKIAEVMKGEKPPYFNAAMYYMDNGKDLNQALEWFTKATEANPKAFWIHYQRANCLAKLGRKDEAKASAEKSIALATEAKNNDYVKLNEKLLKELNK